MPAGVVSRNSSVTAVPSTLVRKQPMTLFAPTTSVATASASARAASRLASRPGRMVIVMGAGAGAAVRFSVT
jgi:ornithine cyclodeaminase/alanine dehydrogenase-like protein (mu-crystallin family)